MDGPFHYFLFIKKSFYLLAKKTPLVKAVSTNGRSLFGIFSRIWLQNAYPEPSEPEPLPPYFGRSVNNSIPTGRADYSHHITTLLPPDFQTFLQLCYIPIWLYPGNLHKCVTNLQVGINYQPSDAIRGKTDKTAALPWFCKIQDDGGSSSGAAVLCGLSLPRRTRRTGGTPDSEPPTVIPGGDLAEVQRAVCASKKPKWAINAKIGHFISK